MTLNQRIPNIFVEWRIESISLFGEVKVVFTSVLDLQRLNIDLLNKTGFYFKVIENQEYKEMLKESESEVIRDLSIKSLTITQVGFNFIMF